MSAPERDAALQAYLSRLLALKGQRPAGLTPEELRAIALELGLTEADLAAGQAEAERYLERGRGFARHARWDDAIDELSAAAALAPGRPDILHGLAEAHASRWRAGRDPADREQAEALARRCLDLAPTHEPSYALLNALDRPAEPAKAGRRGAWVAAVALAAIGAAAWLVVGRGPEAPPPVADVPPAAPPQAPAKPQAPGRPAPLVEIPVTLVADAKSAGMTASTRLSQLTNYPSASYYRQAIALANTGRTEWEAVTLRAEYLNAAGKPIAEEAIDALESYEASVRPGDVHLFNHLKPITPELAAVRLSVTTRTEVPIRALKLVAKPLTVPWAVTPPAGVTLAFKERSGAVSRNRFMKGAYLKPVIEIENTGELTIKTLKTELTAYDAAGRVLKTNQRLSISGDGMGLGPGETRLDHWHEQVPEAYHHYTLRVIEAE